MTIAYWCVLIAAIMPIVWAGVAKSQRFNNNAPREYLSALQGWRKRANWAQQNSWEAFAPFAAAVIIAHLAGAKQHTIDLLAFGFVVARIAYGLLYLADLAPWRTAAWLAGFGCVIGLFIAAA